MKCNICGAPSVELHRTYSSNIHQMRIARKCTNGHSFFTVEVYPSQLADVREMSCAIRRINRRMSLYERDLNIAKDDRHNKLVAQEYEITEARVRQIRAEVNSERK